jgi:hypothetical protein
VAVTVDPDGVSVGQRAFIESSGPGFQVVATRVSCTAE